MGYLLNEAHNISKKKERHFNFKVYKKTFKSDDMILKKIFVADKEMGSSSLCPNEKDRTLWSKQQGQEYLNYGEPKWRTCQTSLKMVNIWVIIINKIILVWLSAKSYNYKLTNCCLKSCFNALIWRIHRTQTESITHVNNRKMLENSEFFVTITKKVMTSLSWPKRLHSQSRIIQ